MRGNTSALLGGGFPHHAPPAQPSAFPPQAQRRAGVTQPLPEEPNPGPEPPCKPLPSGVGPAPPPHAYPPATAVRGCVGTARGWALRAVVGLGPGRVPKDSQKPGASLQNGGAA